MHVDEDLPFVRGPLPAAFHRRVVTVAPGRAHSFRSADWHDTIVVVESGGLDLECHDGGVRSFDSGSVISLAGLALRALRSRGKNPTVLVAVSRGAQPRIVEHADRHYLGIRDAVPHGSTADALAHVPVILRHLADRGTAPAAAPFLRCHVVDGDSGFVVVEAGVPVHRPEPGRGAVRPGVLPGGYYAVVRRPGPTDPLMLAGWARDEGVTWELTEIDRIEQWGCRVQRPVPGHHPLTDLELLLTTRERNSVTTDISRPDRRVPVGDVELCVRTAGSPSDPAVLLVDTTLAGWDDAFCARIAEAGRYVVRYDLRDAGRSTAVEPDAPAYTLRDLVGDAARLLEALGLPRVHVVGMGVGGWIAQLLALDHPSRVATLTLIGTRPTGPGPADDDLPEHDAAVMAWFGTAGEPDWTDPPAVLAHAEQAARVMAGAGAADLAGSRERAAQIAAHVGAAEPALLRASLLGTTFAALDCTPRWRERLGDITAPTLVVHGATDPFFPVGNAEALAAAIPGAELLVLPGVGHDLPAAAHARVAAAIVGHTA